MNDNPFEMTAPTQTPTTSTDSPFGAIPSSTGGGNPFGGGGFGGAQPGGNNFGGNQQRNNNFGGGQQQKRKYKFVQMYILINPKLIANLQLSAGEVPVMEISYNVDYGNLRATFCNVRNDTFDSSSIKVQNMDRATTVNIYPEVAEQLLYNIEHWKGEQIHVFERMIQSSANWTPNTTMFKVEPSNKSVTIMTKPSNGNGQFMYVFAESQLNALTNALKFLVNGGAWNLDLARFMVPPTDQA